LLLTFLNRVEKSDSCSPCCNFCSVRFVDSLLVIWFERLPGELDFELWDRVVKIRNGSGVHEKMDRRAIACFDQTVAKVGLAEDGTLRQVRHDYFTWAIATTMARYRRSADNVPESLDIPRWSWMDFRW
jgi:hemoglobin